MTVKNIPNGKTSLKPLETQTYNSNLKQVRSGKVKVKVALESVMNVQRASGGKIIQIFNLG
jgi:hypothetical protein